jgi:hypothetical protein
MSPTINSEQFLKKLKSYRSPAELKKIQRYFKSGEGEYSDGDEFIGVRMGQVFALAKEFIEMSPNEIEKLLESPIHEARAGAVSIMDAQARSRKTSAERRKELFDLYLRRHDRINNWDLVDRRRDRQRLVSFLDKHAAKMPRTALRYAIEHLDKKQRHHYLSMKQAK